ncbi:MAG: type II toxin-antitoxin system HicA family toxin [SAR324 cluster bacterium]|nr:type II toxin-antitoxin system HicA family toxin [SAR324 cluster bacterium]
MLSRKEKLLTSLLKSLGYRESKTGKTGGSRRRFLHESAPTITLHKPHPQNTLKRYAIDQIIEILQQEDML